MLTVAVISIIVVAIALPVGAFVLLRDMAQKRELAVRQRFPNARIVERGANFYGQESRGVMQMRGNGTLVVTDSELFFEKWIPRQEMHIPLTAIQTIETPSSYLGKTNFRPLLKVVYQDENGKTDSMAWLVRDLESVKQALSMS